jgi:hypothetical protein
MEWQEQRPVEFQQGRHWSPVEGYAPSSVLLSMIKDGWQIIEPVEVSLHWFSHSRCTEVFSFTFRRNTEQFQVQTTGNPVIRRLIQDMHLSTIGERHIDCMQ